MVGSTANLKSCHFVLSGDTAQILPYSLLNFRTEPAHTIFGTEDKVIMKRSIGVGQFGYLFEFYQSSRSDDWGLE